MKCCTCFLIIYIHFIKIFSFAPRSHPISPTPPLSPRSQPDPTSSVQSLINYLSAAAILTRSSAPPSSQSDHAQTPAERIQARIVHIQEDIKLLDIRRIIDQTLKPSDASIVTEYNERVRYLILMTNRCNLSKANRLSPHRLFPNLY